MSDSTIAWLAVQVDAKLRWESNAGVAYFNASTVHAWFPQVNRHAWPRIWRFLAAHGVARDAQGYWTLERHSSLKIEVEVKRFIPLPSAGLTLERPVDFKVLTFLHAMAEDLNDPNLPLAAIDKRKTLLPWAGKIDWRRNHPGHLFALLCGEIDLRTLKRSLKVLEERKFYLGKHNSFQQAQRLTPMEAIKTEPKPRAKPKETAAGLRSRESHLAVLAGAGASPTQEVQSPTLHPRGTSGAGGAAAVEAAEGGGMVRGSHATGGAGTTSQSSPTAQNTTSDISESEWALDCVGPLLAG